MEIGADKIKTGWMLWLFASAIFFLGVAWAKEVSRNDTQDEKIEDIKVAAQGQIETNMTVAIIKKDIEYMKEADARQERKIDRILESVQ